MRYLKTLIVQFTYQTKVWNSIFDHFSIELHLKILLLICLGLKPLNLDTLSAWLSQPRTPSATFDPSLLMLRTLKLATAIRRMESFFKENQSRICKRCYGLDSRKERPSLTTSVKK